MPSPRQPRNVRRIDDKAGVVRGILGVGTVVALIVVSMVMNEPEDPAQTDGAAAASTPSTPAYTPTVTVELSEPALGETKDLPPPASSAAAEPASESTAAGRSAGAALVTRVVDGDTFVVQGGDRIRVLGIDSCETSTSGGAAAKAAAERVLDGQVVNLANETAADRDRYGRLLRYVDVPGVGDLGRYMVGDGAHTGVYDGRNDASPAYIASLREQGADRSCRGSATATSDSAPDPIPTADTAPSSPPAAFKNCSTARAAGAAPVRRGQPGYGPHLDRNNDGVGCE